MQQKILFIALGFGIGLFSYQLCAETTPLSKPTRLAPLSQSALVAKTNPSEPPSLAEPTGCNVIP